MSLNLPTATTPRHVTLSQDERDHGGVLTCPHCGFDHLHHHRVVVVNRSKEDSPVGLTATVEGQGVTLDGAIPDWAGRRDAVQISFSCEGCRGWSTLQVTQHKGRTLRQMLPVAESSDGNAVPNAPGAPIRPRRRRLARSAP